MYNYILDVNVMIHLKNEYLSELWIDSASHNTEIDLYRSDIYL